MAENVLGLIFNIDADPAQAIEAMETLKASTVAESTEISSIWSGAMDAITGPVGIAAGLFVGLGAAGLEAANKWSEFGESLLLASQRTGVSVEALSGLREAALMTNVSFDDVTRALQIASRNLSPFAASGSEATKALASLSLSATDSHGHLKPMDEILREVADKFKVMPDGTLKTADAMAIFGRSGAALIPILDQGSEGLKRFLDAAKESGNFMDREGAEAAEHYQQSIKHLKDELSGLWNAAGKGFGTGVGSSVDFLSGLWNSFKDQTSTLDSLAQGFRDVGGAAVWLVDQVGPKQVAYFAGWKDHVHDLASELLNGKEKMDRFTSAIANIHVETPKATDDLDGSGGGGGGGGGAAGAMRKVGDAAHYTYPHLRTVDDELRSITSANYDAKLRAIAETMLGLNRPELSMGAAPALDPFHTMAQSLNAAIIPFGNFNKQFQVLASIQPQLFTEQQRIILNLKMMAQGWQQNITPLAQQIQQFGLADAAINLFTQTAQKGLSQMASAMGQAAANAIVYSKNFGKAMDEAAKSTAASIASQALTQAIYATGIGFLDLAEGDFPDAALAFEAAGAFALIGGAAAGVGAAIPGGGGGSGGSGGAGGGGVSRGAISGTSGTPRGLGGVSGSNNVTVNVNIQGVVSPDTIDLLTPTIASSMSSAIQSGMVPKWPNSTVMTPNRTAGR